MDETEMELKREIIRSLRMINDMVEVLTKQRMYEIRRELLIKKAPVIALRNSISILDAIAKAMASGMRKKE